MQETQSQGLGISTTTSREVATAAGAMKARAMVEAKFVIALQRPRNMLQVRSDLLESCKRPRFAEQALYRKPVGGREIVGPSIRFAEEALRSMKNIDVDMSVMFEDVEKRVLHISLTDLESNTTYGEDVTIEKTVERSNPGDREVLGERTNSKGVKVYIVKATEDELKNKSGAAKSIVIRNSGLRLIPNDIIEEALDTVEETCRKGGSDPKAETKKICDAFGAIGVPPAQLEEYLGHSVLTISPNELVRLRGMYSAIKDGEASWADYLVPNEQPATTEEPKRKGRPPGSKNQPKETPPAPPAPPTPTNQAGQDDLNYGNSKSPQDQLGDMIVAMGGTFDQFVVFGADRGWVTVDTCTSFSEVPLKIAETILKNPKLHLAGLVE